MSEDKQEDILDAAQAMFLRYGFRRVTMGDIAEAAEMSRPALYLLFPNKEAIFCGVFSRFVNGSLDEIEAGVSDFENVAEQLAFAVEVWTVRPYELLHGTPEGRELAECSYGFAAELVQESYQRFEAILETIFKPHARALKAGRMTPAALAEVFALALPGIKTGATDIKHLRRLVTSLIAITTARLEPPPARDTRKTTRNPTT